MLLHCSTWTYYAHTHVHTLKYIYIMHFCTQIHPHTHTRIRLFDGILREISDWACEDVRCVTWQTVTGSNEPSFTWALCKSAMGSLTHVHPSLAGRHSAFPLPSLPQPNTAEPSTWLLLLWRNVLFLKSPQISRVEGAVGARQCLCAVEKNNVVDTM